MIIDGKFDTLVTIKRREQSQGPIGQPVTTWVSLTAKPVWADVRNKSGAESIRADAVSSSVHASIRVRYREGLTAGMRVEVGGLVYDVKAVLPEVARRRYIDLVCEAVT